MTTLEGYPIVQYYLEGYPGSMLRGIAVGYVSLVLSHKGTLQ